MAHGLFAKYRQAALEGAVNVIADDIRVVLIDEASYTVDLATHDMLDDVPSGARVAVSGSLTGKTSTDGVFDANDITLTSVPDVAPLEAVLIYKHTGTESTSRLIAYMSEAAGGGLISVDPDGGNITVTWPNDATRIYKL